MKHRIGRYGWIPDLPDARDRVFRAARRTAALPPSVDLRAGCPVVYDQGDLGSCTANAIAGAVEFDQRKQKLPQPFTPSRLFIYYNERALGGTIASDSGAMLRDGIKTVAGDGACPESMWPYLPDKFADRPTAQCYKAGKTHPAVQYSRVAQDAGTMKACLAAGYPFVFGFTVYQSFESDEVAHTGAAPMPDASEVALGGHAVLAVGYDDGSATIPGAEFVGNGLGHGRVFYAAVLVSDGWESGG